MVSVDSHGRIVLPNEVRDRLSITPGTEVEIYEENGKIVIEPADSPEQRIERMERLVAETASEQGDTTSLAEGPAPVAQKHRDAIRRGTEESDSG
ncbi:AbrB/MazE/SpoVT family DNA-binding domain-containing protein [Halosegnis longus]|uniref:AbrB/MazE/SpoVT family DNA-binding domain-containing protein n=1 Tax=Halosegnis longus TaxID=2216012 RepID=UPI00129E8494|nr:AbrB/MazE/SpoVT family DNA-binding domain-containing protein [Halosegnis longus]